jgi:hypothetical protein
MIVSVYAFNIVHLVLRVQLHILARYNFNNQPLSQEDMKLFLGGTFQHLYENALKVLVADVMELAKIVLHDVSYTKKLDSEKLTSLLEAIKHECDQKGLLEKFLSNSFQDSSTASSLSMSLMEASLKNPQLSSMIDELFDVVESPFFFHVTTSSIEVSFQILLDQLIKSIFLSSSSTSSSSTSATSSLTAMTSEEVVSSEDISSSEGVSSSSHHRILINTSTCLIPTTPKDESNNAKPLPILLAKMKTDKSIFYVEVSGDVKSSRYVSDGSINIIDLLYLSLSHTCTHALQCLPLGLLIPLNIDAHHLFL